MAQFVYYNINPKGETRNDCVTRAISLASGLPYQTIRKKLYYTAQLLNCEKLCVACYRHLLDDVFEYEQVPCYGMTVNEFADKYPNGTYLIRVPFHITVVKNGVCYDIWNCLDEVIDTVWRVD